MTTATANTRLPPCPKCGGHLHEKHEGIDQYVSCVNCGRTFDQGNIPAPTPTEPDPTLEPEEETAQLETPPDTGPEAELERLRWPQGVRCPHCLSRNTDQIEGTLNRSHMCGQCDRVFDYRTLTIMEDSKAPPQLWLAAVQTAVGQERNPEPHDLDPHREYDPRHVAEVADLVRQAQAQDRRNAAQILSRLPPVASLVLTPPKEPAPQETETETTEENAMLAPTTEDSQGSVTTEQEATPADVQEDADPAATPEATAAETAPDGRETAEPDAQAEADHDRDAEDALIAYRWPQGVRCLACGSAHVSRRNSANTYAFNCLDCGNKFSPRTNTLGHRSMLNDRQLVQALEAVRGKKPAPRHIKKALGVSQAQASNMASRMIKTIELWNARHHESREDLTPEQYLQTNFARDHGQEPEFAPAQTAPSQPDPETQQQPAPTAKAEEPEPAATPTQATSTAEPSTPTLPTPAAEHQQPEPGTLANDPVWETLQRIENRMGTFEQALLRLAANAPNIANQPCPACGSKETLPADQYRPGFRHCQSCGCLFPVTNTAQQNLNVPLQHNGPAITITIRQHQ